MELWRGISRRLTDSPDRRYSEEDYELLGGSEDAPPTPHSPHHRSTPSVRHNHRLRRSKFRTCLHLCLHGWTLKRLFMLVALAPVLLVLAILIWGGIPPSFQDIREFESLLPQHRYHKGDNTSAVAVERRMFLRFPDHLWGHGLNNILQEALLLSYIGLATNRTYVFEDYVWSHLPAPYTLYDFSLRPTRIPLNAFISGPSAGSPLPPNFSQDLVAVSARYFEQVCPPSKRRIVNSEGTPTQGEGKEIVDWWVARLTAPNVANQECVEVVSDGGDRIFDFDFFGSSRILSLYPSLRQSPILTSFQWSPLVHSTILRNFPLLQPSSASSLYNFSASGTLTGLVAVHIRRGDYRRHCPRLANWGAKWNGVNEWEGLEDKFEPPPRPEAGKGKQTEEEEKAYLDYYMEHCLPSQEQIVSRLHAIRQANPTLRRVYVLTNGWVWWLSGLKSKLLADGWEDLKSTLDLQMDPKQKEVGAAVDMAIAERAEVFVGNGFSSLSSNIVMLRMARGVPEGRNRFL